jgi:hypothetical protein
MEGVRIVGEYWVFLFFFIIQFLAIAAPHRLDYHASTRHGENALLNMEFLLGLPAPIPVHNGAA